MKKLFLVEAEFTAYDQYNGLVIVANDIQEAREIVKKGAYGESYFTDSQGEITYTEIDLNKTISGVVLDSFQAG